MYCRNLKRLLGTRANWAILQLLALFIIIATGMYQLYLGNVKYFTFEDSDTKVTSMALSFYSGLFAYNGWWVLSGLCVPYKHFSLGLIGFIAADRNYLNFIIEELKDPVKNLPRAIAISCTLVTVVYVMANVSFYTILSPDEVMGSTAVAVTYADRAFGMLSWTIPGEYNKSNPSWVSSTEQTSRSFLVFVALSTFGAVNGILLTSSRLFYAGANEGQMPEILTMIQIQRFTPTPAVLAMALLSMLYLTVSDIIALINYVGFATWVGYCNRHCAYL